jgi:type II secretory pathway pseudopilin PulG
MTLIEILVVIAVIAVVAAVAVPSLSSALDLQQQSAARNLGQTYLWLIDEAALRNVTFRVVYNLDRSTWKIEVGDPSTLVFADPESREKAEQELEDRMSRYTEREIAEGEAEEGEDTGNPAGTFVGLEDPAFQGEVALEGGCKFAWVYTPQYGVDGQRPHSEPPEDPAEDNLAYSYVFPDGTAEHTVVRIVDEDDEEDGFTVEVEPMGGRVNVVTDIVSPSESLSWLPQEGPEIQ